MPTKARMSSIMGQIELEHSWFFAFEFGKIVKYNFVYTVSCTNINQSAPNSVKMYVTTRSQIGLMSYLPLNLEKNAESDCLHSNIYKYQPISTELGQNVCDHKISDGFDYGFNWTRTV